MNKLTLAIIAILAVIAAVAVYYYFIAPQSSVSQPVAPQTNVGNNTPAQTQDTATAKTVAIQNFSFNPSVLMAKVGDTVVWTNEDPTPHQIKSSSFNSSALSKGQTFSFVFQTAGTFDYSCAIHPSMKGQIIVQ